MFQGQVKLTTKQTVYFRSALVHPPRSFCQIFRQQQLRGRSGQSKLVPSCHETGQEQTTLHRPLQQTVQSTTLPSHLVARVPGSGFPAGEISRVFPRACLRGAQHGTTVAEALANVSARLVREAHGNLAQRGTSCQFGRGLATEKGNPRPPSRYGLPRGLGLSSYALLFRCDCHNWSAKKLCLRGVSRCSR